MEKKLHFLAAWVFFFLSLPIYFLSLQFLQVLDANRCFERQCHSALSLQLAAYYYSLQIYSRLTPCFQNKNHTLYQVRISYQLCIVPFSNKAVPAHRFFSVTSGTSVTSVAMATEVMSETNCCVASIRVLSWHPSTSVVASLLISHFSTDSSSRHYKTWTRYSTRYFR